MSIVTDRNIRATVSLIALPGWGGAPPTITITGPARAVVTAVGRLAGLAGAAEDAVAADLRRCPVHDGDWVIVDARQAESYPAFLAEATPSLVPDDCAAAPMRVRLLGYDPEDREVGDPSRDVVSGSQPDLAAALDWIAARAVVTREHLVLHGRQIWLLGATLPLAIIEGDISASSLELEMAGMRPEDRAVAERVAGLA